MNEVEEIQQEIHKLQTRLNKLTNKKSLKEYIVDTLKGCNGPLTVGEITELVLESGYKTQSKHFKTLVLQALISSYNIHKATKCRTRPIRFELSE